jgi:hypothetical protein
MSANGLRLPISLAAKEARRRPAELYLESEWAAGRPFSFVQAGMDGTLETSCFCRRRFLARRSGYPRLGLLVLASTAPAGTRNSGFCIGVGARRTTEETGRFSQWRCVEEECFGKTHPVLATDDRHIPRFSPVGGLGSERFAGTLAGTSALLRIELISLRGAHAHSRDCNNLGHHPVRTR